MAEVKWKAGYRPSNGTEGDIFRDEWCDRCKLDHGMHGPDGEGPGCEIYLSAIAGDYAYPAVQGPPQWEREDVPFGQIPKLRCTAFVNCGRCFPNRPAADPFVEGPRDRWSPGPTPVKISGQQTLGEL